MTKISSSSSSKKTVEKEDLPNYRIVRTIGYGSFAKVKLAVHVPTGHEVAIKILDRAKIKDMKVDTKVQREAKILGSLVHPHIIRQYEVIETADKIYVVMEYFKSGELYNYIVQKGRFHEDEARHLFQQIISGVDYCHRNRIVHRDLKPENMLLDSNHNIKIADFGLSNVMQDGHFLKTNCGSPSYAAPELILGKLYSGPEVDIWSCGVILYALLCGTLPFDDANISKLFDKIKKGTYMIPDYLSYGAKDLLPRILVVDPLMRISIPQIYKHPWFNTNLPRYLAIPPYAIPATQTIKIDEDIMQHVVNLGFERNQVLESLVNKIQNEATVAYNLILDNQNQNCDPNDNFQSKFEEISDHNIIPTIPFQETASHVNHLYPVFTGLKSSDVNNERSWTLGLQSHANPQEIMSGVFKALRNLKACWKIIGLYNIKCRWVQNFGNNNNSHMNSLSKDKSNMTHDESTIISPTVIKFELQLYKECEGTYLLDIQRVDGPHFIFLDLCVAFLKELRVF